MGRKDSKAPASLSSLRPAGHVIAPQSAAVERMTRCGDPGWNLGMAMEVFTSAASRCRG